MQEWHFSSTSSGGGQHARNKWSASQEWVVKMRRIIHRKVKGRPQRIKIGRYADIKLEQARKKAAHIIASIALGGDPMQERKEKRQELTFKKLADRYYHEYALQHTKRPEDNRKGLEYHILSSLGTKKLSDITRDKIQSLHAKIGKDYKAMANRVMHTVSAIFNYGIRQGYHKGVNPCLGLIKYRSVSRDRFLNKDELKAFFEALEHEEAIFRDFFLLALYTGARKSNVLEMAWADIDLDLKMWRIPETQTKNRDVNTVYLSEAAIEILLSRKEANEGQQAPSPYVFPGIGEKGHLKDPKRAFQRIKDRMEVQDIRIHDLRRTLGSYMAINGTSLPIIGKALNHKNQISTAIYARLSVDPVVDAVQNAIKLMRPNEILDMGNEKLLY